MNIAFRALCWALCWLPLATIAQNLPATDWQQDLAWLRTELPKQHAPLFTQYTASAFASDMTALEGRVAAQSDLENALALQAILAKFQTREARLDLMPLLQRQKLIPLALGMYEGQVYVTATVNRFEALFGRKILAINQIPIATVLSRLGQYVPADNAYGRAQAAHLLLRFPAVLRAAGLATQDTLAVLIESASGKQETIQAFPVSLRDPKMGAQVAIPPAPKWVEAGRLPFAQARLFGDSVLYVRYQMGLSRESVLATGDSTMAARLPSWNEFADTLVQFLQTHPHAKLLLDLQQYTHGHATDGVAFAKRLATMPDLNRADRLWVAINNYTGASGVQMAAAFQRYTRATVLGEPTGMGTAYWSNSKRWVLPRVSLVVYMPTQWYEGEGPFQADVRPAMALPWSIKDAMAKRDPVMEYVRRQAVSE